MTTHRTPPAGLVVTVDVEDHSAPSDRPRFQEALEPLLRALQETRSRATFFVIGSLVADWAATIVELDRAGHEIALHGFRHEFISELGKAGFAEDITRGVGALGDVLGRAPAGYRAPYFSLTRKTPWVPGVLAEAGFTYSSSVLPAWSPQAGLPGAPRQPFLWPEGLVEFPAPVFGIGRVAFPILGGAYLRLVPGAVVRLAARRAGPEAWTYSHPYDFDAEEPYTRIPGQPWWINRLLFVRRHLMLDRAMSLTGPGTPTLAGLASELRKTDELQCFGIPFTSGGDAH